MLLFPKPIQGVSYAERHLHSHGNHLSPSPAERPSLTSPPPHSRAGVPEATPCLSLEDFIPSHLQKMMVLLYPSLKVPVIRNCGSNTLNFEFHDTAARTVQNGISQPQKTSQWNSAYNWYPTWPAKEIRPLKSQAPGWSATWTKDARRKEKRWVKYDGIGPVDESGMPIASRSSVDSPRDWYRSMFQQIHSKLPGKIISKQCANIVPKTWILVLMSLLQQIEVVTYSLILFKEHVESGQSPTTPSVPQAATMSLYAQDCTLHLWLPLLLHFRLLPAFLKRKRTRAFNK
uniref:SoHo domain-containing protein n=1 Tax=Varanus komodoensis TaxID=61221 RepID=A0A8D2L9U0_VARKO